MTYTLHRRTGEQLLEVDNITTALRLNNQLAASDHVLKQPGNIPMTLVGSSRIYSRLRMPNLTQEDYSMEEFDELGRAS